MVRDLSSSGTSSGSRSLDRALNGGSPGGSSTSSSTSSSSLSLQGRYLTGPPVPQPGDLPQVSSIVETVVPPPPPSISPVLSADHLPDFFHHNPEHCAASFAAINKMRQNTQVWRERFWEMILIRECRTRAWHASWKIAQLRGRKIWIVCGFYCLPRVVVAREKLSFHSLP